MIKVISFDSPVAVIGDIHGCYDALNRLLDLIGSRQIISVGDTIDRGPASRKVLDRLIALKAVGVQGNHEGWLTTWVQGEGLDDIALMPAMGGYATLRSYGIHERRYREIEPQFRLIPKEHRDWLVSLPLVLDLTVMETPYWVIHAGYPCGFRESVPDLVKSHPKELLWNAGPPSIRPQTDRTVIMGHMYVEPPYDGGHTIAIDTGASIDRRGRLTALLLPERTFVSVEAPPVVCKHV